MSCESFLYNHVLDKNEAMKTAKRSEHIITK